MNETAYLTGAEGQHASDTAFSPAATWNRAREELIQAAIQLSASKRNALSPWLLAELEGAARALQSVAHTQMPKDGE